jgi:ribonuclease BN (tRNA processing enzyme)
VTHTDDSYAFRVSTGDGGPGLVYSGDCGRALDLAPLVRPGDTLLAEVSFGPGPVPVDELHLDGPSIAELSRRTGPGRILLTHIQMGYDPDETIASARDGFDGEVRLVAPGDELTIGART